MSDMDFDSSINSDDEAGPGTSKRVKVRAGTYRTKSNRDWTKTWPFVKEVRSDPHTFLCTLCNHQVNCGHMGRSDVVRHISNQIHKSNAKMLRA